MSAATSLPAPVQASPAAATAAMVPGARLDHLDAARAFALVLGVVFHASLSFSPFFMGWAVQDVSTGAWVPHFMLVSHSFRMELFFLLAGFFSHGLLQRRGMGAFLRSRAIRLGVPFVAGWFLLRPLLVSGWIMGAASMRGDYDIRAGLVAGFASLKTLPDGLFTGSHLWFLYYLILITGLTLGVRLALRGADRAVAGVDAAAGWLANTRCPLPVLIVPTACALWGMQYWGMDTPDRSLRPHWPVLAVYGGFFAVGWLFGRRPAGLAALGRVTLPRVLLAATGIALTIGLGPIQADPGHPHYTASRAAFSLGYAMMMWALVALTLGVFQRFCSRPRPAIRYLADSSYWMYLIHLPVVVWLQVAVAEVPVHWTLKLAFISAATIGLALLSYDLFVRSTWLGRFLNGHRRERALRFRRMAKTVSREGVFSNPIRHPERSE